ncbi:SDR family NAD(P)-dependent oxidoreductase [Streptomyces sp. J2-1]|uniref:SDR family NAD(P)-dependent oxidoreductase n=1 Tax=Streptomyces corallincola TaxID=2851888 RepID=UPI001C386725|nr:SDR family NAD(P)-dependent oxidoreductase [Streptomyces corallincola]MBV2358048.1 SDR family NAD(P)-dependent oxidoreductase [Streptomyces corallincola]
MSEETPLVWFVTGSSRGFGRALLGAILAAGDFVVATARRPEVLKDAVEEYGDRVLPLALDVTRPDAVQAAVEAAVARFGRVDVLVNNAGYANMSPVETGDEDDFRAQFETNFWGVYHVTKAVLPVMRGQGSGVVVQFSSVGGRVGASPGLGAYQAAKFAVDGFTRTVAVETAPFGIRVMTVEPSGFATDWGGASMTVHDIPEGYDETVGAMSRMIDSAAAATAGDPERAAEIIVRTVHTGVVPSHLLLGEMAADMAIDYSRQQIEEATAWQEVSRSADFGRPYPTPLPGSAD